ncbi:GDNF family receptor alpha-4 [Chelonia mydas]|uniref:GDNF family receptor alpha-4 n=1 Tax=Chelonia mydas TaxID=8469 RepID=M7B5W2_CHEMY|nr:GDNF family receptor alpha-4 [Chelonia mydas]
MDSACNATYQALENCSLDKTRFLPLSPDARARCRDAKLDLRSSPLLHCKCHRRMRRQKHCLRIYWTVHSSFTHGYFNLETSPYEDPANEEPWKIDYNKLAALVSGSHLAGDSANPCLKATHFCSLNKKCVHLRTYYASSCTKGAESGGTCDQRKCHKRLRQFFEKVPEDFTKRLLFCPCQDELCGERRRKTIVPECSFQDSIKPNCLLLLDSCIKDHICKSRLADFQQNCQPAGISPDGCSQHNHAACLQAYMGMIGTAMTPNYVGNSSTEVSLWCTCENSGNQQEECDQIRSMFISNKCLNPFNSNVYLNNLEKGYFCSRFNALALSVKRGKLQVTMQSSSAEVTMMESQNRKRAPAWTEREGAAQSAVPGQVESLPKHPCCATDRELPKENNKKIAFEKKQCNLPQYKPKGAQEELINTACFYYSSFCDPSFS